MFETTTNSQRKMNAQAGFVLAAVICLAILSIWNLFLMLAQPGRVPRPSLALVVAAIFCVVGIFRFRAMPLKLAFALAGTQAAVRVALWLAGAPRDWRRFAALGGEILTELAAIIVIVVIVKWFGSDVRQRPPSDGDEPA